MNSIKRSLGRTGRRRMAVVGAVAAGALVLAACGNDSDGKSDKGHHMPGTDHGGSHSATASPGSSESSAKGAFNDADVKFAQMMIPHHQQAVEMAELSGSRAADKEIKELSAAIERAQGPEIKTLQGWLKAWGKPESMDHGMPGMHHGSGGSGMSGIMSEKDMADLKASKGTAYDKKFAAMMTEHHNGAISMAEDEQKNGRNADAKKLAGAIIKGQTAEVGKFRKLLGRL
ncbi:DUF305 domain-containing protein [Streptomyces chattanoogensis]|uniref:DUF305 domain-containing protein n=1 Tax=Streptomyces chattanoogensis TaxID=66876 RepID=UPI00062CBDD6